MTTVESRIDAVKVYHSGATVSRVAELKAEGGARLPEEVELQGLPLALVDALVRVRVEALEPAGAELVATDVRVGLHALGHDEAPAPPDLTRLKAVRHELLKATWLLRQIELESAGLRAMEVPERPAGEEGKPPPASPMAARVVLEQLVDDAVQQRLGEARTLRQSLKTLREEERELQDRLDRASSAPLLKPHELRKTIVARLVHGEALASAARLVVEYFVPGARWAPSYQCRLSRDCSQAELQLRGLVCQRSGEDWRGVKLTLSTAAPLTWTELPELTSIRIGRAQSPSPVRRGFRPPPRGAAQLFSDYDRDRSGTARLVPPAPSWQAPSFDAAPPSMVPEPAQFGSGVPVGGAAACFDDSGTPTSHALSRELPCEVPMDVDECEAAPMPSAAPAGRSAPMPGARPAPRRPLPAMAPPPPPPPAAPAMARRAKKTAMARSESAREEYQALSEEPAAAAPAAEAILFSQLRLPAPASGERSWLAPLDLQASYLELLARSRVVVTLDVLAVVRQAQQRAAAAADAPLPEGACDVRSVAGYFDYSYQADARVDLESDGTYHSLALGDRQAPSDVRYIVAPREDTSVFRMARLTNPLAAPLLPGPVEVHVGGDYVLSTGLPLVAPRGEFQLGLGVEQAIKVARNTHFSEKRSGTKVVAMTELQHDLEIELVNHLDREILCEVRERLPQPAEDAEVVVEESGVEPAWEVYDQKERGLELRGGRRWTARVGAGKSEKLRASYVVKIYANNELVGGNRREA